MFGSKTSFKCPYSKWLPFPKIMVRPEEKLIVFFCKDGEGVILDKGDTSGWFNGEHWAHWHMGTFIDYNQEAILFNIAE